MKKVNLTDWQKLKIRRWCIVLLCILAILLPYLAITHRLPPFFYPVQPLEDVVFDQLDMDAFDHIILEHIDKSTALMDRDNALVAKGQDMEPILKYLGSVSVRFAFGNRLPEGIDGWDLFDLSIDVENHAVDSISMSVYEGEYIVLSWTPRNRRVITFYRIMDGTLDYNTLAALFPPKSETD